MIKKRVLVIIYGKKFKDYNFWKERDKYIIYMCWEFIIISCCIGVNNKNLFGG